MQRLRRLAGLWNWLPAFRAAAEYESLQRAALALHLSPAALSRTIKLLEQAIGLPLFLRSPQGLTLTRDGVQLLEASRDAMRLVDDALPRATALRVGVTSAPLRVVVTGAVSRSNLACGQLLDVTEGAVQELLLSGSIDLVFAHLTPPRRLSGEQVGVFEICEAGQGAELIALDDERFDAPGVDSRVSSVETVVALARARRARAVLPRVLAPPELEIAASLRFVPIWAIRRKAFTGGRADEGSLLADLVRAALTA